MPVDMVNHKDFITMTPATFLQLGRVSNLPTVVSQVITAALVASSEPPLIPLLAVMFAFLLLYTSGMFLNDAFDASYDREHQKFRPIPQGKVTRHAVFLWGFGLMALSLLVSLWGGVAPAGSRFLSFGALVAAAVIVLAYDAYHKANPLSPLVMGLARGSVYLGSFLVFAEFQGWMLYLAGLPLLYTVGLTFVAKSPRVPDDVVGVLVAGICFVDVVVLACWGVWTWLWFPVVMFGLARVLGRWVRGT